ncbi:MAG TPA: SpoIID/LytB domain-containing protein [Nocardioides sp.]|nr:SpoIID/LytB domain-containing protein [Nocardioides sp.]
MTRLGSLAIATLLAATGVAAAPTAPTAYAGGVSGGLAPGALVSVRGYASGNGVGLSQAGAHAAAGRGLTYRQIDAFYFPHTAVGHAGGMVSVRLTTEDGATVEVHQRPGLVAHLVGSRRTWNLADRQPAATRWLVQPTGSEDDLYYYTDDWHFDSRVTGTLELSAGGAPVRLYHTGQGSTLYRGTLRPDVEDGAVTNRLPLDDYLRGVVPLQLPSAWTHAALLKAQSVAARGYVAYERSHGRQLCDTGACQPYGGASAETANGDAAVEATAGEIRLYGGRPARTVSTRANGGRTCSGGRPYLVAKRDPYDPGPATAWTSTISESAIEQHWPSAGPLDSITPNVDGSGRWIASVTLQGQIRDYTVPGDAFAAWAGLRSSWFTFDGVVPPPPLADADAPAAPRVSFGGADVSGADPLLWPGAGQAGTLTFSRSADDVTPDIDHYAITVSGPGVNDSATEASSWDFTPPQWGYYDIEVYAVDTSSRTSLATRVTVRVP